MPAIGTSTPPSGAVAAHARRRHDSRQHRARDVEQREQLVVPVAGVDVEEQRAAGVGRVGDVHAAAGEVPDQPACRWCRTRARPLGARARAPGTWSSSHLSLVPEKYASSTRPVLRAIIGSWPAARSSSQQRRGPPVLPDDGVARPGGPVARSHSTVVSRWLVMPMAAMSRGADAGLGQRLAQHARLRRPDLVGVVLDPARLREDLPELLLRRAADGAVAVEHERARTGGALVEGEDVGHRGGLPDCAGRFGAAVAAPSGGV